MVAGWQISAGLAAVISSIVACATSSHRTAFGSRHLIRSDEMGQRRPFEAASTHDVVMRLRVPSGFDKSVES